MICDDSVFAMASLKDFLAHVLANVLCMLVLVNEGAGGLFRYEMLCKTIVISVQQGDFTQEDAIKWQVHVFVNA